MDAQLSEPKNNHTSIKFTKRRKEEDKLLLQSNIIIHSSKLVFLKGSMRKISTYKVSKKVLYDDILDNDDHKLLWLVVMNPVGHEHLFKLRRLLQQQECFYHLLH